MSLFRKRKSVSEFATMIFALHAQRYAAPSFHALTDRFKISLEKARLGNALMDWLIFGAYLMRNGVSSGCGENTTLRDALLNSFFDMMYAALRSTGLKELEFFELEDGIKQRFRQYDVAMNGSKNPVYAATLALSTNMFGETADAAGFAMTAFPYSADTLLAVDKLFSGFNIKP